jgi:polar amino acid transport system substrate-binding protein
MDIGIGRLKPLRDRRPRERTRASGTAVMVALACVAALAIAGCGDDDERADTDAATAAAGEIAAPADIASAGRLRICTDPTYPPAEFKQGSEYSGFDIEIAEAIADLMGVETAYVETGFDGIIAALLADKCDAIIAVMTITPEREKAISFVEYARQGYSLMVEKGNPKGLQSIDDLAGDSIAVQLGSTQKEFLEEESKRLEAAGQPAIDVQTFPKDTDAAAALQAGRVDAYFADGAPVAYYVQRNADRFEIAASNIDDSPVGIGVRKDDAEARTAIEAAVDRLYSSGQMLEILQRWNVESMARD